MSGAIAAAAVGAISIGAEAYEASNEASAQSTAGAAAQQAESLAAQEATYAPALAGTGSWQEQIAQTLGNQYQSQDSSLTGAYSSLASSYNTAATSDLAQYQALLNNPSSITSTPGYQFELQQGEQATTAGMAAQGYLGSGNMATSLESYAEGLASTTYNQQLANLANAVSTTGQLGQSALSGQTNASTAMANLLAQASGAISGATSGYSSAAAALGGAASSSSGASTAASKASDAASNTASTISNLSSAAGYDANSLWSALTMG